MWVTTVFVTYIQVLVKLDYALPANESYDEDDDAVCGAIWQ